MNYAKGYEASYYLTIVDAATWRDTERIEITGGSINREATGLRNSATVTTRTFTGTETWARVYLDARQGDSAERIPIITGLISVPERRYNGLIPEYSIQIYSVLKPLEDVLLPRGYYAAAGAPGAAIIADLMQATPAPVVINGESPRLSAPIIAEQGETNLSMTEKILTAINWRIRLSGAGTVELTAAPTETAATFDALNADFLEPDITIERDLFSAPNVYRATSGDLSGIARDEDPASPLSIPARGREVWREEESADLNEGETIAEYAARRLKEEQRVAITATYARRFLPNVYPGDYIYLRYPEQELQGVYEISSQGVSLSYAGRTTEEVLKIG